MANNDSPGAGAFTSERVNQLKLQGPPERTLSGERLRRAQRLRSPRDFQRVRAQGRRVSGALLTLGYVGQVSQGNADAPGYTRVGFSVSRRVGGAVVRNHVKRRLREVMRRRLAGIAPGYDIVITARPGAATASYAALDQEIGALLTRVRFLIASP